MASTEDDLHQVDSTIGSVISDVVRWYEINEGMAQTDASPTTISAGPLSFHDRREEMGRKLTFQSDQPGAAMRMESRRLTRAPEPSQGDPDDPVDDDVAPNGVTLPEGNLILFFKQPPPGAKLGLSPGGSGALATQASSRALLKQNSELGNRGGCQNPGASQPDVLTEVNSPVSLVPKLSLDTLSPGPAAPAALGAAQPEAKTVSAPSLQARAGPESAVRLPHIEAAAAATIETWDVARSTAVPLPYSVREKNIAGPPLQLDKLSAGAAAPTAPGIGLPARAGSESEVLPAAADLLAACGLQPDAAALVAKPGSEAQPEAKPMSASSVPATVGPEVAVLPAAGAQQAAMPMHSVDSKPGNEAPPVHIEVAAAAVPPEVKKEDTRVRSGSDHLDFEEIELKQIGNRPKPQCEIVPVEEETAVNSPGEALLLEQTQTKKCGCCCIV
ncbi:hypothetical protein CYMTET_13759 [Cymbomonas tetramitiformis]|uniref:Uncharacterized protein n=1 Tax=Cymbomonas tetramitiformis TaxID=36881 RepID=A0AAE0GHU6_9CHLO|nr:hypothetical protein CYMTET_13759 [Cymbomonas tetramitiformis]